jgi:6-phosphofructokinase 1
LTGGGDVPGLNVAIKAVATRAVDHGIEVVGLRRGWLSLLHVNPDDASSLGEWTMALPADRVRTFDRTGGTILHTSRTNPSIAVPRTFSRMSGRRTDSRPRRGGSMHRHARARSSSSA